MNRSLRFLPMGLCLLGAASAFGWGQKGHDTVCYIAQQHLTPATLDSVERLLDNHSIVYYANWLDNASHTPEYAYSKTWHYKNVDEGVSYENAPENPDGDIVRAICSQTSILQDSTASDNDKSLALKMVIHFLGDLHQPMHLGHLSDRGGNGRHVKFFKRPTNLHSVWDTDLPEAAHKWSHTEWAREIDRASDEEIISITSNGNPVDWAKETLLLASKIYNATPEDYNVSYDYIAAWTPVIERQFLKGGLRLADILNSAFDPSYTPNNNFTKRN